VKAVYSKAIEYFFFPVTIVLIGFGVNFVSSIAENTHKMTVSIQVLVEGYRDHELRIRELERSKGRP